MGAYKHIFAGQREDVVVGQHRYESPVFLVAHQQTTKRCENILRPGDTWNDLDTYGTNGEEE